MRSRPRLTRARQRPGRFKPTSSGPRRARGGAAPDAAAPSSLAAYVAMARPDYWFKNVFMLFGAVLAFFCHFGDGTLVRLGTIAWAFAATCLVASSNYVLNEILDAPTDRAHPIKRNRPIPSGRIRLPVAYAEWLLLAVAGLGMAWAVNLPLAAAAGALWIMGIVYNVRPLRTKELPYLDTLSESVNNPIRLALGWFAVTAVAVPPLSLLISYWMAGGFFMATKRFAEYRQIGDPARAAAYRASFGHYNENKLLLSMFFYATAAALFLGVFIIRYHLELILSVPLIAGFFSYYFWISLKDESAAQAPERLYRERGLMLYLIACLAVFAALMFVRISILYVWFNMPPSTVPTLWEL